VEYEWLQPVKTDKIDVFLWDYQEGFPLPLNYRVKYWDGNEFKAVDNATGLGLKNGEFNTTTFDPVTTTRLRIEVDSASAFTANVVEWKVYPAPGAPGVAPVLSAGGDRVVMTGGTTYLSGSAKSVTGLTGTTWSKASGPGPVAFKDANAMETSALLAEPGEYVIKLTAKEGKLRSTSTIKVKVQTPPPAERLDVVYTKRYTINSPLWNDRAKAIIVNWIPWCIDQIKRADLNKALEPEKIRDGFKWRALPSITKETGVTPLYK
jgi:hypothetical protein